MSTVVELKRCPFCGGKAELSMCGRRYVYCTVCRARSSGINTFEPLKPHTKMAVEQWNKRVSDARN